MEKLYIIHGLKRSGNHAIINWIKAGGKFLFFNNIIGITSILRGWKTMPDPVDFNLWLQRKIFHRQLPLGNLLLRTTLRNRSIIASLEDHDLQIRPFQNIPCTVRNILILRDPHNLLSSRIRKSSLKNNPEVYPKDTGPFMQRVLQLWKSHAREYLGITNFLDSKVCIYFNSWFSNINYRRHISRQLDFKFTDRGFSGVSASGLGSSFDGTRFDGDNKNMDVLNRRSHLSDSEQQLLDDVLKDQELHDLAQKIAAVNHNANFEFET